MKGTLYLHTAVKGHSLSPRSCQGALFISAQLSRGTLYLRAAVKGHSLSSLSGTFLHTLPELVTPLKGHSLFPRSCERGTLYLRAAVKGHALPPCSVCMWAVAEYFLRRGESSLRARYCCLPGQSNNTNITSRTRSRNVSAVPMSHTGTLLQ